MSGEKKGLLKPTIQITALSIVNIVLTFVSQLVVAYYFGATWERDAYFSAVVIPTYLSTLFVSSIGAIFLPVFVDVKTQKGEEPANKFRNNVLSYSLVISFIVSALVVIFSNAIIAITAPGFTMEESRLSSELLSVLSLTIVFQVITNLASSVLQVQHRFILPSLAPLIAAAISLITVLLFTGSFGILSLAYGTLAGSAISAACLLLPLHKIGALKFVWELKNKEISRMIHACIPLFIAGIFYRSTSIFERSIASTLEEGSISFLGYGNQIMFILATLTSSGIAATIYPKLSRAWSEKNLPQIREMYIKSIRIIFLLTLPLSIIFIFWGVPIFTMLFERGAFTQDATYAVSSIFSILTIALIANSLGGVIAKIFYLTQRTLLGSFLEILSTICYVGFAYFLSGLYSYNGIAMAASISTLFTIITSFIFLRTVLKGINIARIANVVIVGLIASLVPIIILESGLVLLGIDLRSSFSLLVFFVLVFIAGYYLLLKLFNNSEVNLLEDHLRNYFPTIGRVLKPR